MAAAEIVAIEVVVSVGGGMVAAVAGGDGSGGDVGGSG